MVCQLDGHKVSGPPSLSTNPSPSCQWFAPGLASSIILPGAGEPERAFLNRCTSRLLLGEKSVSNEHHHFVVSTTIAWFSSLLVPLPCDRNASLRWPADFHNYLHHSIVSCRSWSCKIITDTCSCTGLVVTLRDGKLHEFVSRG